MNIFPKPVGYLLPIDEKDNIVNYAEQIGIFSGLQVAVESFSVIAPETDDTARINRAIDHAYNNGGGTVKLSAKKYTVNGKIILKVGVRLDGSGIGFTKDRGTVLWRDENTVGLPLIEIGTGNSVPFVYIGNMTMIGSSIDQNAHGIVNNTTGLHGFVFENIHFEHFAGEPIKLVSSDTSSRIEFGVIRKCHSGMAWDGTYKTGISNKGTNPVCTGVHLTGAIDGVRIEDSVFLANSVSSGIGILVDNYSSSVRAGDCITVENTNCSGNNIGISSTSEVNRILSNYLEGNNVAVQIKALGLGTTGTNNFEIHGNLFASCPVCIDIVDDSASVNRSAHGTILNNYVYTNYTSTPSGIEFIRTKVSSPYSRIFCMANSFITTTISGATGIRFFEVNSDQTGFTGQNSTNGQQVTFGGIKLHADGNSVFPYEFKVNANTTNDYGLEVLNKDGQKLAVFQKGGHVFYNYSSGGTQSKAFETDYTGKTTFSQYVKLSKSLELTAIASSGAPNNSLFIDSADNKLKFKDNAGVVNLLY